MFTQNKIPVHTRFSQILEGLHGLPDAKILMDNLFLIHRNSVTERWEEAFVFKLCFFAYKIIYFF